MSMSPKLVFFGTDDFSTYSLLKLISSGFDIVAVVSKPNRPAGRGRKIREPAVAKIAKQHSIDLLQPEKLNGFENKVRQISPTHGVLVAYGKIIPEQLIAAFPGGIINVHPSLLPKYRGPSPVEAAILNGDKKTGVSLIQLNTEMDQGPIFCQTDFPLTGHEDRLTLNAELGKFSAEYLIAHLPPIIEGKLQPQKQDDLQASYCNLLTKKDGLTDWQEPAEIIERKVRAFQGFPKLRGEIFGQKVTVLRARVAKSGFDGNLVVGCKPGWLEIIELIAPSGRTMSGADYIRGYKKG